MPQTDANANELILSYLSSLDEDYYYFIASNILGKITSPFNKQTLNRSILSFFLNPENLSSQISSMDEREKQMLAVACLLNGAQEPQFLAFCSEMPYYVLSLKLENLCDRLLLFKIQKDYVINPLLKSYIESFITSSIEKNKKNENVPFGEGNTARAVFNLLINGSVPQREANIHHFIKSGRLELVFPKFEEKQMVQIFELYKNLALKTRCIERNVEHTTLHLENCRKTLDQNNFDLNMHALEAKNGETSVLACCKALAVLRAFPTLSSNFTCLIDSLNPNVPANNLLEDLKALGMVYTDTNMVFFNESVLKQDMERSELTISTDLTVSYYGTPKATDILFLFANIQTCDNLVVYTITKDSFARGLDLGISKKTIENYLNNNLVNSYLDQWEKSVSRIKLYEGIVLNCTNEVSVIVKGIPDISDHIIKEFSDNIFLMRKSTLNSWSKVLAKALDLETLPAPITEHLAESEQDFTSHHNYSREFIFHGRGAKEENITTENWKTLQEELIEYAKKNGFLNADLEELINSKLIISKSQIGKNFKYSKLSSASGFDYNAKLSLIKKASGAKRHILRIELTNENLVVLPIELVKNENGKAILKAKVIPTGEERNIPVGSIFKVSETRSI